MRQNSPWKLFSFPYFYSTSTSFILVPVLAVFLLFHQLLKHKLRQDLQSKIHLHSDFKRFIDKLFPLQLRGENNKIPHSENEAKQN